MKGFWFWFRKPTTTSLEDDLDSLPHRFKQTYQALSSASVETLWQILTNLGDMSWHPLIDHASVPQGQTAKPGLIYRVMPRCFPIPIRIFVERVSYQEVLSIRVFSVPGVEEQVIYRLESTVLGTQVSYSVMVRGWLSPLAWSVLKPYGARIAEAIAKAAEETANKALPPLNPQKFEF